MPKEQAIFLLKPDAFEIKIRDRELSDVIVGLLLSSGLEILEESEKKLSEPEIRTIFPVLDIPDEKYGEAWKDDVIKHISSRSVRFWLLEGEDAIGRAKAIRNTLRVNLCNRKSENEYIVKNIAHVADAEDLIITRKVLFNK